MTKETPIEIYPAIDLRAGSVVRLRHGDPAQQTTFDANPAAVAHRWAAVPRPVRRAIAALDTTLSPHPPFNRLGDHFLIELVRR